MSEFCGALCFCDKCRKAFVVDLKDNFNPEEFMEDLSKNGCTMCKKEENENPKIYVLQFLTKDEVVANQMYYMGYTKSVDGDFEDMNYDFDDFSDLIKTVSY